MNILAIDPGTNESGYIVIDSETLDVLDKGIADNNIFLTIIRGEISLLNNHKEIILVVEGMHLYGAVSEDTVQTLIWTGRFIQRFKDDYYPADYKEIKRSAVRKYFGVKNDAGIKAALVDKFELGSIHKAKGTKKEPGCFYGFKYHIWQAYALAVMYTETEIGD